MMVFYWCIDKMVVFFYKYLELFLCFWKNIEIIKYLMSFNLVLLLNLKFILLL